MEGLPPAEVRRRNAVLQRKAARLERWMRTGWRTTQKGEAGKITCTYKDQPPWRIELLTTGALTCLQLRHLETGKVVVSKEARSAVLAKEDAWDLWHEGEALRTAYLAEVAAERKAQRAAEQAKRKRLDEGETARQAEEWERDRPAREARAASEAEEYKARVGFVVASGDGWELRVHKLYTTFSSDPPGWGLRIETTLVGALQVFVDADHDSNGKAELGAEDCTSCCRANAAYSFGATRAEAEAAAIAIVPRVPRFLQTAWLTKWRTSKKGNPWMKHGEWRLVVLGGRGARLLMTHLPTGTDLIPWPYDSERHAQLYAMGMLLKGPRLLETELRKRGRRLS